MSFKNLEPAKAKISVGEAKAKKLQLLRSQNYTIQMWGNNKPWVPEEKN